MINNAKWICCPTGSTESCYEFVKEISIDKPIQSAKLYISCIGIYFCSVNNKKVTQYVLSPGWTNYSDHVQYQEYDVTALIEKDNTLRILCGNGWAHGPLLEMENSKKRYCDNILCIFALCLTYKDNTTELIISDKTTSVYTSQTRFAELYNGETVDRTYTPRLLGYADEADFTTSLLPQTGEWIKEQETLFPAALITTENNQKVIDFGQNITGYVCVKSHFPKGSRISFRHAEVLDSDGNFYTANYRTAQNKICYISGGNDEEFKPQLSFQGFRYICIDEFPDEIDLNCFRAIAVHSDIKRTGYFVCGNQKLNQLYSNMLWGQKDNFLDIPTDCPQRDERLGWTGDAQVFARTAALNFNVEKFFEKWLYDLRTEQLPDGAVPAVIPNYLDASVFPVSAAWGDCAVICPWEIYRAYGNKKILSDNFECMQRWIEYMHSAGSEEFLWLGGNHFGDWLGLDGGQGSLKGSTDADFIASCFFAHSTQLFIKAGNVLDKDMSCYEDMLGKIKQAIRKRYTQNSLPVSQTQTACVLLIAFDITDNAQKVSALLERLIKENGTALTTGFVGTPYLLHALTKTGKTDLAYDLLFREDYPSWLYSVNKGATTIWEHWDGIKEDGSFWSDDMNSFNHYAYGSVFDWVYSVAAGINIKDGSEGYKEVILSPTPDKRLGFVKASVETPFGTLRSNWTYQENYTRYEFEIPYGMTAHVRISKNKEKLLKGGKYVFFVEASD